MEITETLYVTTPAQWRRWLQKNSSKKKEIWLVYYNKASGKKRIPYNDAVDQALCFGWIDSIMKKIDRHSHAQRFTPRRNTSILSQLNKERVRKLIAEEKMTPAGLKAIEHVFNPQNDKAELKIPKGILSAIKKDKAAWKNFQSLPERYKRIRIAYILDRKGWREKEYKASLKYFIKMTAKGKRFGFVRE